MRLFSHQKRSLLISLVLLCGLGLALLGSTKLAAHAANANITLATPSGPPTSVVKLEGSGFGSSESVALFFDTISVGNRLTDSQGTFSTHITIPASAVPGNHTMRGSGQTSGLSAQASFLVATSWEMLGFDAAHTGFNSYENVLSSTNVSGLVPGWSYRLNSNYSSLAVADGVVYAATTGDTLIALNATTGKLLWSNRNAGYLFTAPVVVAGIVYVGSSDRALYAFSAQTGTSLWRYTTGGVISSSPVIDKGVVYVGSDHLYVLDALSGTLRWSYGSGTLSFRAPVVAGGVVYASADKLYALDLHTGNLLWTAPVAGSLVTADGNVYVNTTYMLYAVSAKTGAVRWQYPAPFERITDPAAANGVVYVNTYHQLKALNAQGGKELWRFYKGLFNPHYIRPSQASPVLANGVVYVDGKSSNGDQVYAIDATTGTKRWSTLKENRHTSYPVVVNGVLYLGSDQVYTFHLPGTPS